MAAISNMTLPRTEDKVAFLSMPEAYPDAPRGVEIRQTHMSWVFLTDHHAWKLKKPVRTAFVDFRKPEARRRNCLKEVRLNRRLAPGVYLGVEPLTLDRQGRLRLRGFGKTVDWLVHMQRLPADRMLDSLIVRGEVSESDVLKLAAMLAGFYAKATRVSMTAQQYRDRLAADLEAARRDLTHGEFDCRSDLAESVIQEQLGFLVKNPNLAVDRAREGRIIEGHGDLRPEHVCLKSQPVIIDCLEFNRNLRILDAASELAFLALECERLGAPEIGKQLLHAYQAQARDWPSNELLEFYRAYHAVVRARIAIWHLRDDSILDKPAWIAKAEHYLKMAAHLCMAA
jgi:aminoglycoside phosphotransferase family enzyme